MYGTESERMTTAVSTDCYELTEQCLYGMGQDSIKPWFLSALGKKAFLLFQATSALESDNLVCLHRKGCINAGLTDIKTCWCTLCCVWCYTCNCSLQLFCSSMKWQYAFYKENHLLAHFFPEATFFFFFSFLGHLYFIGQSAHKSALEYKDSYFPIQLLISAEGTALSSLRFPCKCRSFAAMAGILNLSLL